MVKRYGNLWKDVVSMDNIKLAYTNARKGKTNRTEVRKIDQNPSYYLESIRQMLIHHTFRSSKYRMFVIHEGGKDRDVVDLPFYPDRIIHWAIMQVIEPIIMHNLIHQTYAALPGKGSHLALKTLKKYVRDPETKYCFKMDVRKFFPSIDKDILMTKLRRRIKDTDVLWLLSSIIYEFPYSGLPIGNYTSQFLANFYLSDIDHDMKENYHCRQYLRYMDDIVILGRTKTWLRRVKKRMDRNLSEIGLTMKKNWQIFPIDNRGIDFVGYRTFKDYCLIRRRTKKNMKRRIGQLILKMGRGEVLDIHDLGCLSSYRGCLMHCDGHRLGMKTIYRVDEMRRETCSISQE